MWQTVEGTRKLVCKERRLFEAGAGALFEWLKLLDERDDDVPGGTPAFDKIPVEKRRWLLLWVAEAPLGDEPPPPLAAWNEGTVLAVFIHIQVQLWMEIEAQESNETLDMPFHWRSLVTEAWIDRIDENKHRKSDKGEGSKQPINSLDFAEWSSKVEFLTDLILSDRHCQLESMMYGSPHLAEISKRERDILDEYYVASPPLLAKSDKKHLKALYLALPARLGGFLGPWPVHQPAGLKRGARAG